VVIKENVIDVENYIHAADAGIYASEREECSLAMLETMANEKPLIATATGGTPELIGDSGLLCQLGDIDELADHIDTLSENHGCERAWAGEPSDALKPIFPGWTSSKST
jgi:glycosyltransferase involved in cell wall biosynthesis